MTSETSGLNARITAMEHLITAMAERVRAMEIRLATAEQSLSQKWGQGS